MMVAKVATSQKWKGGGKHAHKIGVIEYFLINFFIKENV
jgi:hypothetical protein